MHANKLPVLKEALLEYREAYAQVLQDALRRLDKAFQAFVRRVKQRKGKAGFLMFKPIQRHRSFTSPQSGLKLLPDGHIQLSKIGELRVFGHRELAGKIKTLKIKKDSAGGRVVLVDSRGTSQMRSLCG